MKTDFSLQTPIFTDLVKIATSTFYHTTSCPKNKLFNQISSARKVSTFLWAKSDGTRIIREDLDGRCSIAQTFDFFSMKLLFIVI